MRVVKFNKRLCIEDERSGNIIYTPPDFVSVPGRHAVQFLANLLDEGVSYIDAVMAFEKTFTMTKSQLAAANILPKYPDRWKVGMTIEYTRSMEWGPRRGEKGKIVCLSSECADRDGGEYQVFWTTPIDGDGVYWTTPKDVRWVSAP